MNGESHSDNVELSLDRITEALEAVYSPRSSNELRREATVWLDSVKNHPQAAALGHQLASDANKPLIVRHFGLTLLEHAIKYKWDSLSSQVCASVRAAVIELAQNATDSEAVMLRNKIAQLWVELAKRTWLSDWQDMDERLCELWHRSFAHQDIVLYVLETLSEEIFAKEESASTSVGRGQDLGKACVEIFTPAKDFSECYPDRDVLRVRSGEEGWVQRLASMLEWCESSPDVEPRRIQDCAVKVLGVMRSIMPWIALPSVYSTNSVALFCRSLTSESVTVRMAAVNALHALYHRSSYHSEDIIRIVCPIISSEGIALLRKTFHGSHVEVDNIDEEKYTLLKKFTEILCALAAFVDQRTELVMEHSDVPGFLQFLLEVVQNPSMVVSIPVLYIWTKLIASRQIGGSDMVTPLIGTLLDVCKSRLLKYEALSQDSSDPTYVFLCEDFDTIPERHAFVGNYRRFAMEIVDRIVRKSPFEAMRYILGQADGVMQTLLREQKPIDRSNYTSSSPEALALDAQTTVVMTALKGYLKYIASMQIRNSVPEDEHHKIIEDLERWCASFSYSDYQDPSIQKRLILFVTEIAIAAAPQNSRLPLAIIEHILNAKLETAKGDSLYDEAVKELNAVYAREIQKLAVKFSDQLSSAFLSLEQKVNAIQHNPDIDIRVKLDFQAFLFLVIHRSSSISKDEKAARLRSVIEPVVASWQDPALVEALANFNSFCKLLGLDQYPPYFLNNKAQDISDWSSKPLDAQGITLRDGIADIADRLPLQPTRSLLAASTDRIRHETLEFEMSKAQWKDTLPIILPNLLQFLGYAHGFNNPANWTQFSPAMETIVKRTLVDRVWQSGISSESRDDFYARVRNSKSTLEGLASSIRASIRGVRELSYWILHCACQFGEAFYSHQNLADAVAHALYTDAHTLSAHQLSTLLRLSTAIIDSCPAEYRATFLLPILTALFKQLDVKIRNEWEILSNRSLENADEETLDREMKSESVLRQLTYSAVMLVSTLLDHRQPPPQPNAPSMRALILGSPGILEPIMVFCTHALRMHDTRSCGIICRVLRHLVPDFAETPSPNQEQPPPIEGVPSLDPSTSEQLREFASTEVLKACISSLHEPYFVELQKDLAWLIATILVLCASKTDTPRNVLLSLPGMTEQRVDSHLKHMLAASSERQQRGFALSLLEGLRGISIYEQGKVSVPGAVAGGAATKDRKKGGGGMQAQFAVPMEEEQTSVIRGGTPELADLFG